MPNVSCISANTAGFVMIVTVITFPFHILIIKVLISDLRLSLPRHNIMLCLSISDALQIFITFSCMTTMYIFGVKRNSGGCNAARSIFYFNLVTTLVVSSLSIFALSMERYVACVHSFRLHQIFTRERMIYGILCIWFIGIICGAVTVALTAMNWKVMTLSTNHFVKIITVIFIVPTSILICIIQYRLWAFSHSKLARIGPGITFGSEAEISDLRKKQIKITLVASIVAIAYIVCMLPMGCLSLYELIWGTTASAPLKRVLERLMVLNNFVDPFIYGIGIADSRKAVLRTLKRIRDILRQS